MPRKASAKPAAKASAKHRAPKTQMLAETVRRLASEARKAQRDLERASLLRAHQQQEAARKATSKATSKASSRKPAKATPKPRTRRSSVPDEIPFNFGR